MVTSVTISKQMPLGMTFGRETDAKDFAVLQYEKYTTETDFAGM